MITKKSPYKFATAQTRHKDVYSVEIFHIYTDERINDSHNASLNYLKAVSEIWDIDYDLVVLIDNYNPKEHLLDTNEVIKHLCDKGYEDIFIAFEASMVDNAKILLNSINSTKLKKQYDNYIRTHGKYPCSLLTATWYLTRLGVFENTEIIRNIKNQQCARQADRLISILPKDYKEVEEKALRLISHSDWAEYADKIQALFYPKGSHRKVDLF